MLQNKIMNIHNGYIYKDRNGVIRVSHDYAGGNENYPIMYASDGHSIQTITDENGNKESEPRQVLKAFGDNGLFITKYIPVTCESRNWLGFKSYYQDFSFMVKLIHFLSKEDRDSFLSIINQG